MRWGYPPSVRQSLMIPDDLTPSLTPNPRPYPYKSRGAGPELAIPCWVTLLQPVNQCSGFLGNPLTTTSISGCCAIHKAFNITKFHGVRMVRMPDVALQELQCAGFRPI